MKKKMAVSIALLIIFLLISSSTFTIILTQKPTKKEKVSLNVIGNITWSGSSSGYGGFGLVYDSED
ncbi:MAG: hypothetical protein ACP5MB_11690, partial [bacterium]